MSSKKKKIIIIILVIAFILELAMISYYFIKNKEVKHNVELSLLGEDTVTISLGTDYIDDGVTLIVDNIDRSNDIKIDRSNLDNSILGTYKIKYYIVLGNKEYSITRNVSVVDTTSPDITLNGNDRITILRGEEYQELGYTAVELRIL